jgi:hypothetical protein
VVETTDAHRDTATISTETEEIASAEGPALALVLVLAARRDEEADTTRITTAREAQTAAAPTDETTTTITAEETEAETETATVAEATVVPARPRQTTEILSTNLLPRPAEEEVARPRPPRRRPKRKARKKANSESCPLLLPRSDHRKEDAVARRPRRTLENRPDVAADVRVSFLFLNIVKSSYLLLSSSSTFEIRKNLDAFSVHFFAFSRHSSPGLCRLSRHNLSRPPPTIREREREKDRKERLRVSSLCSSRATRARLFLSRSPSFRAECRL